LEQMLERLRSRVLPESFRLYHNRKAFSSREGFIAAVSHGKDFIELVSRQTGTDCAGHHVDTYQSGFLGSIALSLWFMSFSEDNWFSYGDVHREVSETLCSRASTETRIELRLIRGKFPPMNLDLPVLVDYGEMEMIVLSAEILD
jgi:hypothetical protein